MASLDGEWEFYPDPRQQLTSKTLRKEDPSLLPSFPRSSHILHFGAVDHPTTVWLNRNQVGEHQGGYLPFELDVTEARRRAVPATHRVNRVSAVTED